MKPRRVLLKWFFLVIEMDHVVASQRVSVLFTQRRVFGAFSSLSRLPTTTTRGRGRERETYTPTCVTGSRLKVEGLPFETSPFSTCIIFFHGRQCDDIRRVIFRPPPAPLPPGYQVYYSTLAKERESEEARQKTSPAPVPFTLLQPAAKPLLSVTQNFVLPSEENGAHKKKYTRR